MPWPWASGSKQIRIWSLNELLNIHVGQRASKLTDLKDLDLWVYLIKGDFFGTFNFDLWQFWYPLDRNKGSWGWPSWSIVCGCTAMFRHKTIVFVLWFFTEITCLRNTPNRPRGGGHHRHRGWWWWGRGFQIQSFQKTSRRIGSITTIWIRRWISGVIVGSKSRFSHLLYIARIGFEWSLICSHPSRNMIYWGWMCHARRISCRISTSRSGGGWRV